MPSACWPGKRGPPLWTEGELVAGRLAYQAQIEGFQHAAAGPSHGPELAGAWLAAQSAAPDPGLRILAGSGGGIGTSLRVYFVSRISAGFGGNISEMGEKGDAGERDRLG